MHHTRLEIIRELRKAETKSFSQLLSDVAETSDNLTYHLKYLVKDGYVESAEKGIYKLSTKGLLFINTNQDKYEGLYPTVSVMLVVQDRLGSRLLMRKLKHPHIGKLHDITFMLRSEVSIEECISDFCKRYSLKIEQVAFKNIYRKRGHDGTVHTFDKVFLVHTAQLVEYEHLCDDREFVLLNEDQIAHSTEVLNSTKLSIDRLKSVLVDEQYGVSE